MTKQHHNKHLYFAVMIIAAVFIVALSINKISQVSNTSTIKQEINLTGADWKLWLDKEASWRDDDLYLPSEIVSLKDIPTNEPTVGWESMYTTEGLDISIPANVEEYFGEGNNYYTYHGVSWFWKDVKIPLDWQGKTIRIKVEKARLRAEIYVNEQLAGYDIISETPFDFDISEYLIYGKSNKIAIRITNPGGRRGWEDYHLVRWGSYVFPAGKDFGGIGGEVILTATDNTYINDIFVKNLLPTNNKKIELMVSIANKESTEKPLDMTVNIFPYNGGKPIFTKTYGVKAEKNNSKEQDYAITNISQVLTVPNAELWDIDSPNLYYAEVVINDKNDISDVKKVRFGFRTFEVKEVDGVHNMYFNGNRIRHRSAIDWGYYAQGGNYATDEMALKSVQAAKDLGQNGINFHRQIGEPLVFKHADELGLYMYQEPGSFHVNQGQNMTNHPFAVEVMKEKITRMVIRDRNNPSLIWYNLANEDNADDNPARMWALEEIAKLDGTRLVTNSSGDNNPTVGHIKHIRPYETEIRKDFIDHHTVSNTARFEDRHIYNLNVGTDTRLLYWGESGSYTGPSNWYLIAESQKELNDGRIIYDLNIYQPLSDKISEYFNEHITEKTSSGVIKSPADVSIQAARGLMYSNGRIGQATMWDNNQDGFALNGWSSGPQLPDAWDSAMLDEARNVKGPAEDYAFWVRELQIAIRRKNGIYFDSNGAENASLLPYSVDFFKTIFNTATFDIHLINEGKLPPGEYNLKIRVKDGSGEYTSFLEEMKVDVRGGDIYGQVIVRDFDIKMKNNWKGGYITVDARLYNSKGNEVTYGIEQVLLRNRASFKEDIDGLKGAVYDWSAAQKAITDTGVKVSEYTKNAQKLDYILAGTTPDGKTLDDMLKMVKGGTFMLIRFDADWASLLFEKGILSEQVTEWGGKQTRHWQGNGWGYIDYFVGNQVLPSGTVISTNGWEVPTDPLGFYPFKSAYSTNAYGAYMARNNDLKVLIGTIDYGDGKILLNPGYLIDEDYPFNDMLFYNFISMNCN